jgi:hypothetical protein
LTNLSERILSEQVKKGSVVMPKTTTNPMDVKKMTDQGLNVELREKELKGGQKKIDANKNGKIDAEDFKMLRKGKKSEMDEDLGGMEDSHPEFGDVNFGKLTHKEKMEKFPRYYNPLSLKDKRKNDASSFILR